MSKKRVHVTPRPGGWAVTREGATRASSVHSTQKQAKVASSVTYPHDGLGNGAADMSRRRLRTKALLAAAGGANGLLVLRKGGTMRNPASPRYVENTVAGGAPYLVSGEALEVWVAPFPSHRREAGSP